MDYFQIMILSLQVLNVTPRRHSSSSESIENLLYYRDYKPHTELTTTTTEETPPRRSRLVQQGMDCKYPKMCCSMSCNNEECNGVPSYPSGRQGIEVYPEENQVPHPQVVQTKGKKKKLKPITKITPLARRDFGFTKDSIKSLISQDGDIRKILKDLVRVTMQKVDLVEAMKASRNVLKPTPSNYFDDDYLEE